MCGKTAETSDLQDLLIAALQGLSAWAVKARANTASSTTMLTASRHVPFSQP
ncbi:hypothetical protein ACLBOM_24190 [Escherichia coli]